jgi:hypothetical protein
MVVEQADRAGQALAPRVVHGEVVRIVPSKAAEWRELTDAQRRHLTPEALARWTDGLHPDDYTLAQIADLERRRQVALRTLRAGADLTDTEYSLVRYLQRNEGRTVTYLQMARHLWSTPERPVTAALLASHHGYAAPMVITLHGMVSTIRRKLEIDPWRPQHLCNVRGVGYRWYSAAPSLDDGEDYDRRARESVTQREQVRRELGLVEGEFVVIEGIDRDGTVFETRFGVGPEHRDYQEALGGGPDARA